MHVAMVDVAVDRQADQVWIGQVCDGVQDHQERTRQGCQLIWPHVWREAPHKLPGEVCGLVLVQGSEDILTRGITTAGRIRFDAHPALPFTRRGAWVSDWVSN